MQLLSRRPSKAEASLRAVALPEHSTLDVHGESHYQRALRKTARLAAREHGERAFPPFRAFLVAEPDNKYDPNAIAVYSEAGKLGYVPRKKAPAYRPVFEEIARQGYEAGVCTGVLTGGQPPDWPSFGVLLHLSHADDCLRELEEN